MVAARLSRDTGLSNMEGGVCTGVPVTPAVGQTSPDPGGPQCPFRLARNVGVQEFAQF